MFDVEAAREAWREMITQCEADKLVFLDESGVNIDLNRRYGRAIGGERSPPVYPVTIFGSIDMLMERWSLLQVNPAFLSCPTAIRCA